MQNCFAAIYAFASFPLVTVCKDGFLLFFFCFVFASNEGCVAKRVQGGAYVR